MADTKDLVTTRKQLPSKLLLDEMYRFDGTDLWWKERPLSHFVDARAQKIANTSRAGKKAGHIDKDGRYVVYADGKEHYAHRIIWKMVYDEQPPDIIDHRDGNPLNNSVSNLRAATHAQNMANSKNRERKSAEQLGVPRGVFRVPSGKFQAFLFAGGKTVALGLFKTVFEAVQARNEATLNAHSQFARLA